MSEDLVNSYTKRIVDIATVYYKQVAEAEKKNDKLEESRARRSAERRVAQELQQFASLLKEEEE